jgi:hypothetical protein
VKKDRTLDWKQREYGLAASSKAIKGAYYTIYMYPNAWKDGKWMPRTHIALSYPANKDADGKWTNVTRDYPLSFEAMLSAMTDAEREEGLLWLFRDELA